MNIANQLLFLFEEKYKTQPAIYDEFGEFSYSNLGKSVEEFARFLSSKGIQSGNCVGIRGRNSREFIILVLAVLKCEATVLPISNQLKRAEVKKIIAATGLHFLLDDKTGEQVGEGGKNFSIQNNTWRIGKITTFLGEKFANHIQNPAIMRFSSGTTGTAKGVILSHQSIVARIEAANEILQLGQKDTVIWVLQMAYHLIVSIILYLRFGAAIALVDNFLAASILDYTNRFKGTLLYASPMHIRLLANDQSTAMMPSMQRVISTSTAIASAQCEAFEKRFNISVSQAYGIIEVGLPIINHQKSKEVPDAVGYALPAYQVEILGADFTILTAGKIGELAMRGPGMFDGYLQPPRTRSAVLEQGWFLTGDLASKNESGLIKIEGRKKGMINVSGNKAFPEEIEQVLDQHFAVAVSRVKGFQHRLMGELVMAEVVLKEGQTIEKEALMTFCRQQLVAYKVPKRIDFVESLPMTGSGKLKR